MSQVELSVQCRRGRDWVHYLESGAKLPDQAGLELLAAALETTSADLAGDMSAAPPPAGGGRMERSVPEFGTLGAGCGKPGRIAG